MSNQIQKTEEKKSITALQLVQSQAMQKKFQEVLGEKKNTFVASLISALTTNKQLATCEPNSVVYAALTAASLDLPINQSLGYAHIIPYKVKGEKVAQFQIGYKGFLQLAMRSGQYRKINVLEVKEGEFKGFDRLTEEIQISWVTDEEERDKLPTAGYVAYFELVNGFRKTVYWSKKEVELHAKKYSEAYKRDLREGQSDSFWTKDFDSQARKTVLKALLSKWGILSVEMQTAIERDQAVIGENEVKYIDNPHGVEEFDNTEDDILEPEVEVLISSKEVINLLTIASANVGTERGKEILKQALVELGYRDENTSSNELNLSELTRSQYELTLKKIDEIKSRN